MNLNNYNLIIPERSFIKILIGNELEGGLTNIRINKIIRLCMQIVIAVTSIYATSNKQGCSWPTVATLDFHKQ